MPTTRTVGSMPSATDRAATLPVGRLPYQPLERLLRAMYDGPVAEDRVPGHPNHGYWCDNAAALMLDTNITQVVRWRAGGLTPKAADKAAARLNMHPGEIWGWLPVTIAEICAGHTRKLATEKAADTRRRLAEAC